MRKVLRWVLPALTALALTTTVLPGGASAQTDAQSRNMQLLYNNPTGFTNSDLAFWGPYAFQGHYGGFQVFHIADPTKPRLIADVECFGPQNDVSVQRGLLILSVDRTLSGPRCGSVPVAHDDPNGWEGLRIFDVSDPYAPRFVRGVYQDCGSHTNTILPIERGRHVLVYNQSYPLRPGPTCGPVNGPANGQDPLHGKIQIVKISVADPKKAYEIAEPPVTYFGDPDNRFDPQEHGLPEFTGPPTPTNQLNDMRACHDAAILADEPPGIDAPYGVVGAACAEQAQVWRIKRNGLPDTQNPVWIYDDNTDETGITGDPADPGVAVDFWHSATFTWDGRIVNFSDESFADDCPPTTEAFNADTGRTFFFRLRSGEFLSHYMIPRPEPGAYCSTHQGNVMPDADNYYLIQAWYMGGAVVLDFTNPRNPQEIAFWDSGPPGATGSDVWAHYWYESNQWSRMPGAGVATYATDGIHNPPTGRGFEVFRVGIEEADAYLNHLNPQLQQKILFP